MPQQTADELLGIDKPKVTADELLGISKMQTADELLGINSSITADELLGTGHPKTMLDSGGDDFLNKMASSGLGAMGKGLGMAAKGVGKAISVIETPYAGLGGLVATGKGLVKGQGLGGSLAAGAKSIEAQKGVANELLPMDEGWKKDILGMILSAPIDPATYLTPAAIVKIARIKPALTKLIGAEAANVAGPRIAKMTMQEASDHLAQLASAAQGPDPLIKVVSSGTPLKTVRNINEKVRRLKLDSEVALQWATQASKMVMELTNQVLHALEKGLPFTYDQAKTATTNLIEAARMGDIPASVAARWLGNERLTDIILQGRDPQFIAQYYDNIKKIVSKAGYTLGVLGNFAKKFGAKMPKEAMALTEKYGDKSTTSLWKAISNGIGYAESFRKQMIVSNLSLAMRDFRSHGYRYFLNGVENAMNSALANMTGNMTIGQAFKESWQDVASLARAFTKQSNKEVDALLARFPMEGAKMLSNPYLDRTLFGRFGKAINVIHTASFTVFNKAAFEAQMIRKARTKGVELAALGMEDVEEGVRLARTLTYSALPQNQAFRSILQLYRDHPWLSAVGPTFPRMWANLMTTLYDFSGARLFSKATYEAMSHQDPKIAYGAVNRSVLGLRHVAMGWTLSAHGMMDGAWYQVDIGKGRMIDGRREHPFINQVFWGALLHKSFMAYKDGIAHGLTGQEAIMSGLSPIKDLNGKDIAEMTVSLKRTEFSGIPVLDALMSDVPGQVFKKLPEAMASFAGQWLASLEPSILTKTPQDIIGQWNREERLSRFTKDRPIMGPMIRNIPFLERQLDYSYSPLRSEVEEHYQPLKQQLSGVIVRQETPVEMEARRIGLRFKDVYPHIPDNPQYNNVVAHFMGPYLEKNLSQLMSNKGYLGMSKFQQKQIFMQYVNQFKRAGTEYMASQLPPKKREEFFLKRIRNVDPDILKALMQKDEE